MVSRRTSQQQFLLNPTTFVNLIFLFCVAMAARKTNVVIHALVVMSNHWHVVLTDVDGRLPEFCEWVHKYTAKCLNASMGRWENLWSSDHYSAVLLTDRKDVLDKILYVLCNPVSAGLVASSDEWPGLVTRPDDYKNGPLVAGRPEIYFDAKGPIPAEVELTLTVPPAFSDYSPEEFSSLIAGKLRERENDIREKMAQDGRTFLGAQALSRQSPTDSPRTYAPHGNLSPQIAAKDRWLREESIRRLQTFIINYREARARFLAGEKDVQFPAGTYWMKRHGGVACKLPGEEGSGSAVDKDAATEEGKNEDDKDQGNACSVRMLPARPGASCRMHQETHAGGNDCSFTKRPSGMSRKHQKTLKN